MNNDKEFASYNFEMHSIELLKEILAELKKLNKSEKDSFYGMTDIGENVSFKFEDIKFGGCGITQDFYGRESTFVSCVLKSSGQFYSFEGSEKVRFSKWFEYQEQKAGVK